MKHPHTDEMLSMLRSEKVETWFELGLLIDRLRENRLAPPPVEDTFSEFKKRLGRGTAFITFDYGVDGVTMEVAKYARSLTSLLPNARIHYIAGAFANLTGNILDAQSS